VGTSSVSVSVVVIAALPLPTVTVSIARPIPVAILVALAAVAVAAAVIVSIAGSVAVVLALPIALALSVAAAPRPLLISVFPARFRGIALAHCRRTAGTERALRCARVLSVVSMASLLGRLLARRIPRPPLVEGPRRRGRVGIGLILDLDVVPLPGVRLGEVVGVLLGRDGLLVLHVDLGVPMGPTAALLRHPVMLT
jgi:hypothetical protein